MTDFQHMFKKKLITLFLCSLVLISSKSFSDELNGYFENNSSCFEAQNFYPWQNPYRTILSHTEGNWLDNHQGYTSIGMFSDLPFFETCSFTPFIDVRGHFFNDGKTAANVGIGFRYQKNECSEIYGINAFYDFREASWGHDFHKLGIGFEYLGECLDFRLNTYLPVGNGLAHSSTKVFSYEGGYIATARLQRLSYSGADFEIGTWLRRPNSCHSFDLYGAIGAYYYAKRRDVRNEYGSQARLEARFLNYFAFEIKGGFDEIYHGMAQGTLAVAIPLDLIFNKCRNACETSCPNDRRIYQSVNRQEIIALSKKQCCMTWNWDSPNTSCCGKK